MDWTPHNWQHLSGGSYQEICYSHDPTGSPACFQHHCLNKVTTKICKFNFWETFFLLPKNCSWNIIQLFVNKMWGRLSSLELLLTSILADCKVHLSLVFIRKGKGWCSTFHMPCPTHGEPLTFICIHGNYAIEFFTFLKFKKHGLKWNYFLKC